ncbi:MAG: hypothetical protein ACYSR0_11215 [Planctomycetota bacterium]|jgi:hypothetical protein
MFYLRIYDNFHHMDESSAYNHGKYKTYELALGAARSLVREFFIENRRSGMTKEELLAAYSMYGEEPIIRSDENADFEPFSAREYAKEVAGDFCKK